MAVNMERLPCLPEICAGVGEHHDLLVLLHSWDFISFQKH
jgi:hypothetical protein